MRVNICFATLVVKSERGSNPRVESVQARDGRLGTAKQESILAMENENVVFLLHQFVVLLLVTQTDSL